MQALVTGATGLLGRRLLGRLPGAVVLSRDPVKASAALPSVRAYAWSPEAGPPPAEALAGVEAVFHLAGEPVGQGRWNAERKRRIRDSRVLGTRHLVASLGALAKPPRVLVSASAVGYYGDRGDEELDETSAAGRGFLADVCREWEREALLAEARGIRVVCARMGIVLSAGGGVLARMLPPFRVFLGGRLGSGRQWMPWIHIDDAVGILLYAARDEAMRGPVNAVGPAPVTNAEFTRALGQALGRPAVMAVPGFALRAALGEMSELLTASQRALPRVAARAGYVFRHASLAKALAAELGRATPSPAGSSP
jgi:uncharacterized protein (TIGR01777 family)